MGDARLATSGRPAGLRECAGPGVSRRPGDGVPATEPWPARQPHLARFFRLTAARAIMAPRRGVDDTDASTPRPSGRRRASGALGIRRHAAAAARRRSPPSAQPAPGDAHAHRHREGPPEGAALVPRRARHRPGPPGQGHRLAPCSRRCSTAATPRAYRPSWSRRRSRTSRSTSATGSRSRARSSSRRRPDGLADVARPTTPRHVNDALVDDRRPVRRRAHAGAGRGDA